MLVVTIGTVASASTWTFNITRALLALGRPDVVSLFAERAGELLSNVPDNAGDIVVKAHAADHPMLMLLKLADSRVILSYRDPKDSVVSQMERVDSTFRAVMTQLSTTLATFAMIVDHTHLLILRYEDDFPSDRETLTLLAQHLGVTVANSTIDALFQAFRSENVKHEITNWVSDAGLGHRISANTATYWHPGHIGDGLVGKWQGRLSEAQIRAVSQAFPCDFIDDSWKRLPIYWSSVLFQFTDNREPIEAETLFCSGTEEILVYGPYLRLPAGRWHVLPALKPISATDPVTLKVDISINLPTRGQLQLRTFTLPTKHAEQMALEFDNINHLEPIEIRISSVNDRRLGRAMFSGINLTWLGPVEQNGLLAARHVSETDLVLRVTPELFDTSVIAGEVSATQ
jgi:Sulfotransferase domain